jgi:hypothetical protein
MIALLLPHTGGHAPRTAVDAVLASVPEIFRRVLRMPWRKRAVPAEFPAAGAATAPLGDPVLRDRWTWEVCAEYDAPRPTFTPRALTAGEQAAHASAMHEASLPYLPPLPTTADLRNEYFRPVNGRYLGTLPRRTPAATLGRAPWETGSFTVPADVTLVPARVHGETCVANVLEAERLAEAMQP